MFRELFFKKLEKNCGICYTVLLTIYLYNYILSIEFNFIFDFVLTISKIVNCLKNRIELNFIFMKDLTATYIVNSYTLMSAFQGYKYSH